MKLGAVFFARPGWVRWVRLLGGSSNVTDVRLQLLGASSSPMELRFFGPGHCNQFEDGMLSNLEAFPVVENN